MKGNVSGLFKSVQDLDILCTLRGEIISSLIGDEAGLFETDICGVLVKEIAGQISRIMTSRVEKLHDLESMARDLLRKFTGMCHHVDQANCSGGCDCECLGSGYFETFQSGSDTVFEVAPGQTCDEGICNAIPENHERNT